MSDTLKLLPEEQIEILEMVIKPFGSREAALGWLKDIPIIKEFSLEGIFDHKNGAVYAAAMMKLTGYEVYPSWFSAKYEDSVNLYMKSM